MLTALSDSLSNSDAEAGQLLDLFDRARLLRQCARVSLVLPTQSELRAKTLSGP